MTVLNLVGIGFDFVGFALLSWDILPEYRYSLVARQIRSIRQRVASVVEKADWAILTTAHQRSALDPWFGDLEPGDELDLASDFDYLRFETGQWYDTLERATPEDRVKLRELDDRRTLFFDTIRAIENGSAGELGRIGRANGVALLRAAESQHASYAPFSQEILQARERVRALRRRTPKAYAGPLKPDNPTQYGRLWQGMVYLAEEADALNDQLLGRVRPPLLLAIGLVTIGFALQFAASF